MLTGSWQLRAKEGVHDACGKLGPKAGRLRLDHLNAQDEGLPRTGHSHVQQARPLLRVLQGVGRPKLRQDLRDARGPLARFRAAEVYPLLVRKRWHEHDLRLSPAVAPAHDAALWPRVAPALGHRADGKLEPLGGVDGHDAHRVLPAPGEGGRWDLGELKPGVELPRRTSRPEAELVGEVADVVDGSKHVGLARAALLPFLLEPREPA